MSNGCILTALMTEKRTEQRFNHMTAKLIECNINNEYSPFSAVKRVSECKRTEKNKREAKQ